MKLIKTMKGERANRNKLFQKFVKTNQVTDHKNFFNYKQIQLEVS